MLLEKAKKKPLFEGEFEDIIPSNEEMLFLKLQNEKCGYFYRGILNCRNAINSQFIDNPNTSDEQGYLPCLEVTDAYYQCITNKKFGGIKNINERHKPFFLNFTTCYFDHQKPIGQCRRFLDDILRYEFRSSDSILKNQQIIQNYTWKKKHIIYTFQQQ